MFCENLIFKNTNFNVYNSLDSYCLIEELENYLNNITPSAISTQDSFNYILNPNIDSYIFDYNTYKDTAQVVPVDGTGGTPSATISYNNILPLFNKYCFFNNLI